MGPARVTTGLSLVWQWGNCFFKNFTIIKKFIKKIFALKIALVLTKILRYVVYRCIILYIIKYSIIKHMKKKSIAHVVVVCGQNAFASRDDQFERRR